MNRKKLSGTINDYQPIFIKCSDWLNTSEWLPVNKAQKIEPARCFTIGWKIKTHKKITVALNPPTKKSLKKNFFAPFFTLRKKAFRILSRY